MKSGQEMGYGTSLRERLQPSGKRSGPGSLPEGAGPAAGHRASGQETTVPGTVCLLECWWLRTLAGR